ncbi:unnamed protein product [Acanthoscelides obtectus]|uniref:Zinc finger HIT domain-containing protein 3 n=1 Tax=Acanthoscelides obtectus TaxID=200917 RepID=A0A9P0K0W2_ACAOB|nr:unnamed protein product [Acanthoscelides obtectus]CAK1663970.1 Zinc finger HIT domain-containing protein 3 [Acanthoscelides obtectus]
MNKTCEVCQKEGRYKCPTCLIFYCSVTCCRKHRENKCEVLKSDLKEDDKNELIVKKRKLESTETDTVLKEKLELIKTSEDVKKLLANGHLRNLLVTIDKSENAEEVMQKAMQEPIFLEFADACLKVVEPQAEEDA